MTECVVVVLYYSHIYLKENGYMAKKVEKTTAKNKQYSHREDAQWLTKEICAEYRKKALQIDHSNANDIGGRRTLRIELQEKCDIIEN